MKASVVVKLGGAALSDKRLVETACRAVAFLRSHGAHVVVVHGGGPAINLELTKRGITWEFFEGQRITTPVMMDGITHALKGVNSMLASELQGLGTKVSSFAEATGLLYCEMADARLQRVGKVSQVRTQDLEVVLDKSSIPLIAPLGTGPDGMGVNINADVAAAQVAIAMNAATLLYFTDQDAILDQDKSPIPQATLVSLQSLIDQEVVTGGMLAKVRTIMHALSHGVQNVHVINAAHALAFVQGGSQGTHCQAVQENSYAIS